MRAGEGIFVFDQARKRAYARRRAYTHAYARIRARTRVFARIFAHMRAYARMCAYMRVYARICTYMRVYARTCAYMRIYSDNIQTLQFSCSKQHRKTYVKYVLFVQWHIKQTIKHIYFIKNSLNAGVYTLILCFFLEEMFVFSTYSLRISCVFCAYSLRIPTVFPDFLMYSCVFSIRFL